MVIEVRPGTQAEWVEALEMFKSRPELSVTVVTPTAQTKAELTQALQDLKEAIIAAPAKVDRRYDRDQSSYIAPTVTLIDPGLCQCGLIAGHKVKCVKRKVSK